MSPSDASASSPVERSGQEDLVLAIRDLTRRFASTIAVDGLDLEVRRGEIFALLGPNGAGKTTTISMICGLLNPDSGSIELRLPNGKRGKSRIGLCPQAISVWETLTCREQLELIGRLYGLPRQRARARADQLLEELGLVEKADRLARTLSGGMQRRLNIALALVHEPELLILDEPQAGLDPQSRVLVRDYIRQLRHLTTVVLTTHEMDEAERLADRVAIIDHGRLLVCATTQGLKDDLGPGDIVEVTTGPEGEQALAQAASALDGIATQRWTHGKGLTLLVPQALDRLRDVTEALSRRGVPVEDVRVRPRTLEDVFIALTGRSLRE